MKLFPRALLAAISLLCLQPVFSPSASASSTLASRTANGQRRTTSDELRTTTFSGSVQGYRLWGIEPDGDPLYQVVLQTRLAPAGGVPAMYMIVDAYLENFKPDTTPILPDLLHPNQTAQNLTGFLQGKALLTDDAGNVLYIGSFVDETFLNGGPNHLAMQLFGSGNASGTRGVLKGSFELQATGKLAGSMFGRLALPAAARAQLVAHRGQKLKPLTKIISTVTVKPAPMVGKRVPNSTSTPLNTGYGSSPASNSSSRVNPVPLAAGAGAIVCFLLAVFLYIKDRRRKRASVGA